MREYELVCIFEPNQEKAEQLTDDIQAILSSHNISVTETEKWGLRKMAYYIKKHLDGFYVLFHFSTDPEKIHPLEKELRLREDILRFLTIRKN